MDHAQHFSNARVNCALAAVLLSSGPRRPEHLHIETLVDAESRFLREQDLPLQGLLLVRPDGYLALVTRSETEELSAYLNQWLRPNP